MRSQRFIIVLRVGVSEIALALLMQISIPPNRATVTSFPAGRRLSAVPRDGNGSVAAGNPPGSPLFTLLGFLWLAPAKWLALEPAAWLAQDKDPSTALREHARDLVSVRLCDDPKFDADAFQQALLACAYRGPIVIDLRECADPWGRLAQLT